MEGEIWKIGSVLLNEDMTESEHYRKLAEISSEHTENRYSAPTVLIYQEEREGVQ